MLLSSLSRTNDFSSSIWSPLIICILIESGLFCWFNMYTFNQLISYFISFPELQLLIGFIRAVTYRAVDSASLGAVNDGAGVGLSSGSTIIVPFRSLFSRPLLAGAISGTIADGVDVTFVVIAGVVGTAVIFFSSTHPDKRTNHMTVMNRIDFDCAI